MVGKTAEVARCRLDLVCDRTTDGLALRRVRLPGGAIAPTLCCAACATAANNEVPAAVRPQP